jgi:hypothetical protein
MEFVKQYSSFIKRIVTSPEHIRVHLLQTSNVKIITAISEIVYNIIHKNIKVSPPTLTKLKKFKTVFHKLVGAKDAAARKQILVNNPKCLSPLVTLFK